MPLSGSKTSAKSQTNEVAIIGGTGRLGFALALRWLKAGKQVIIGSRDHERAARFAKQARNLLKNLGKVEGMENSEAAARADTVVLSVPYEAHGKTLRALRKHFRRGQIIVDVCVPTTRTNGRPLTGKSPALQAVRWLPPYVHLVSGFHTLSSRLVRELSASVNCDVVMCSDSSEAKQAAMDLAELIPGVRAVDGGPISNSPAVEQFALLLLAINSIYGVRDAGIRITNIERGYSPRPSRA